MPKERNLEFRVGVFVIVAFLCLMTFVFSIGDSSIFEKGKIYRIVFEYANGLKKSAAVRIAGVESGRVHAITVYYDQVRRRTMVEVLVWIKNGVSVPRDSRILINQLGLLGEKYVEIIPGREQDKFYSIQDTIVGHEPVLQEDITQKILDVTTQVEKGIAGLNKIINDEENQHSIKNSLAKLSSVTEKFDRLTGQIDSGHGTVGKLFFDEGLYDDLKALTADLKNNPWKLLYRPSEHKPRR